MGRAVEIRVTRSLCQSGFYCHARLGHFLGRTWQLAVGIRDSENWERLCGDSPYEHPCFLQMLAKFVEIQVFMEEIQHERVHQDFYYVSWGFADPIMMMEDWSGRHQQRQVSYDRCGPLDEDLICAPYLEQVISKSRSDSSHIFFGRINIFGFPQNTINIFILSPFFQVDQVACPHSQSCTALGPCRNWEFQFPTGSLSLPVTGRKDPPGTRVTRDGSKFKPWRTRDSDHLQSEASTFNLFFGVCDFDPYLHIGRRSFDVSLTAEHVLPSRPAKQPHEWTTLASEVTYDKKSGNSPGVFLQIYWPEQ